MREIKLYEKLIERMINHIFKISNIILIHCNKQDKPTSITFSYALVSTSIIIFLLKTAFTLIHDLVIHFIIEHYFISSIIKNIGVFIKLIFSFKP